MILSIILAVLIGGWVLYNIIKMVDNVRHGRSIDGCNGDCANCSSACKGEKGSLDRAREKAREIHARKLEETKKEESEKEENK